MGVNKTMKSAAAFAALLGAVILNSGPAFAATVYVYDLENTNGAYTGQIPHLFGQEVYDTHPAAIHGNFGGGSSDHYAVTQQPATIKFYVDETALTLERVTIENYAAQVTGIDVNYQTGAVSPGQQGDFNQVNLNIDADLSGHSTQVILGPGSRQTGELSVRVREDIKNAGTLTAQGPAAAGVFDISAMTSPEPVGCSVCVGIWGDYADIEGPVAEFKDGPDGTLQPNLSTWLPFSGWYTNSATGARIDIAASFDINSYLRFRGVEGAPPPGEPIPEPATALLLAAGLAGISRRRIVRK